MTKPVSGARINVKYRAKLSAVINKDSESITALNIKDALKYIKKQYGAEAGKLAKTMLIAVNGQSIHLLRHFKTAFKDGDEIGFFPICGGG